MNQTDETPFERYTRQMVFPGIALAGQRQLMASRVLVVGVGGLGSWTADLLARAGVGALRLVDADRVDLTNLHRQGLYDQADADAGELKVTAAARRIARITDQVAVEPIAARCDADTIADLAGDVDLILDGTDNFAARFVINDYAVKTRTPWIFAGVVGAEGQIMTIVPPRRPCLRCLFDSPPPPCVDPACRVAGVLGPAVAVMSALQACEAVKLLAGAAGQASPYLTKLDLWTNTLQQIHAARACAETPCPCCGEGHYDHLHD